MSSVLKVSLAQVWWRESSGTVGGQPKGKSGADVKIVSIVTPTPPIRCFPPLDSLTLRSHVQPCMQRPPLYLSQQWSLWSTPFTLISVAQINFSLHVPAVWSYDILWLNHHSGRSISVCLAEANRRANISWHQTRRTYCTTLSKQTQINMATHAQKQQWCVCAQLTAAHQ